MNRSWPSVRIGEAVDTLMRVCLLHNRDIMPWCKGGSRGESDDLTLRVGIMRGEGEVCRWVRMVMLGSGMLKLRERGSVQMAQLEAVVATND